MPLHSIDESESLMIRLQYASMPPFNHYINASKTFQKRALVVFQLSYAFTLLAWLATYDAPASYSLA